MLDAPLRIALYPSRRGLAVCQVSIDGVEYKRDARDAILRSIHGSGASPEAAAANLVVELARLGWPGQTVIAVVAASVPEERQEWAIGGAEGPVRLVADGAAPGAEELLDDAEGA